MNKRIVSIFIIVFGFFLSQNGWKHLGLLKLPTPMEPHPFAAPAKLSAVCNENVGNEKIIAIGRGLESYDHPTNTYLADEHPIKHVHIETLPQDVCESKTKFYPVGSVICSVPEDGKGPFRGDSGIFEHV